MSKAGTCSYFRIKDWDEHFENNRTRELKSLSWIPVPNKHDGDGYTELISHEHGAAHLGVWLAILQVASKCEVRGTLVRDNGKPHDSISLSRLTRIPKTLIEKATKRLCHEDIGWVEIVDNQGNLTISQDVAAISHPSALEGKGIEEKEKKVIYEDFLSAFNASTEKRCRVMTSKAKRQLTLRLKEGFTFEEIISAAKNCAADPYHRENAKYLTPEFITRDDKLQKYLQAGEPTKKPLELK